MSRLGALVIFISVGYKLSVALAYAANLKQPTTAFIITGVLIVLWLLGVTVGMKTRPEQIHQSHHPAGLLPLRSSLVYPVQITLGSLIFGLVFIISFGVTVGYLIGIGIFKSSLWAFLGTIFNPFITFILFVPTILVTVKLYGRYRPYDGWIKIAGACRQGMWIFSGLSVLIVYGVSRWIGGSLIYGSPFLIAVSASLAHGVFSTGYASGFIHR